MRGGIKVTTKFKIGDLVTAGLFTKEKDGTLAVGVIVGFDGTNIIEFKEDAYRIDEDGEVFSKKWYCVDRVVKKVNRDNGVVGW